MKRYSLGFMFDKNILNVLLIRKKRPSWQYGFLNGVGGHVEDFETPIESMVREFEEEVGIITKPEDWKYYCLINVLNPRCNEPAKVYVFTTVGDVLSAKPKTDEYPVIILRLELHRYATIDNLSWLIPLAVNVLINNQPLMVQINYRQI